MKRNILTIALCSVALAAGAAALASCGGSGGSSKTPGNIEDYVDDEGILWFNSVYVPGVAATCQSEGRVDSWYCEAIDGYFARDMSSFGTEYRYGYDPSSEYDYLSDEELITSKTPHDYDKNGVCTMCGEKGSYAASEGLKYELTDDESGKYYSVKSMGACADEVVVIPSAYNSIPVLKIADNAFEEQTMRAVVISEGITEIGENAFSHCEQLESVFLPDSMEKIGNYVFSSWAYRLGTYENGLLYVDNWAVDGRTNVEKAKGCTIREGTVGIGPYAASDCSGKCVIPESVKHINANAFYSSDITSLQLNDNIETIEAFAFAASDITSVTFGKNLKSIGEQAFYQCAIIQISLPETVTEIGAKAFNNCYELMLVTLPSALTKIGICAFMDCRSLMRVEFGDTEGWISKGAEIDSSALSSPAKAAELLTSILTPWTKKVAEL